MENYLRVLLKQKTFVVLFFLVIVFFLLDFFGVAGFFTNAVQKISNPIEIGLYKSRIDLRNFFSVFGEIGSLKQKETDLAYENSLLLAENASLKKLETENKVLREQLGDKIAGNKLITVSIIGQDPLFSSSKIMISKGSNYGIEEGNFVVIKDILIGKVSTVHNSTSLVRLLTDPDSKVPAITSGNARGILEGEFGNNLVLNNVAQNESLQEGEIVFSSGEADYPQGLVLGKIKHIDKNPAAIFQTAEISPIVPFEDLETVFVMQKL
jgi:rod shape-determining protein MreC